MKQHKKFPLYSIFQKPVFYIACLVLLSGALIFLMVMNMPSRKLSLAKEFVFISYQDRKCNFLCTNNSPELSNGLYVTNLSLDDVRKYINESGVHERYEPYTSAINGVETTILNYNCPSAVYYMSLSTQDSKVYYRKLYGSIVDRYAALVRIPKSLIEHMNGVKPYEDNRCYVP